jgi:hypothetical protein
MIRRVPGIGIDLGTFRQGEAGFFRQIDDYSSLT